MARNVTTAPTTRPGKRPTRMALMGNGGHEDTGSGNGEQALVDVAAAPEGEDWVRVEKLKPIEVVAAVVGMERVAGGALEVGFGVAPAGSETVEDGEELEEDRALGRMHCVPMQA
jgi:hypothetical protein